MDAVTIDIMNNLDLIAFAFAFGFMTGTILMAMGRI